MRDGYEASDLPDKYKVMLRYVDTYLNEPTAISDDLRMALKEHFSEEEVDRATFIVGAASAGSRLIIVLGLEQLYDPERADSGGLVFAAPRPVERDHPL